LLAADPDRFAAALVEIDANLKERAEELLRTRERIARLRSGDRLFVSEEVADYLDQLHELGVSQRSVRVERDGWILMQSVSPKRRPSRLLTNATLSAIRSSVRSISHTTRRLNGPPTTRGLRGWPIAPGGGSPPKAVGPGKENRRIRTRQSPMSATTTRAVPPALSTSAATASRRPRRRRHSSLSMLTPIEFEARHQPTPAA
jgi:hypothetical protein